MARSAAEKTRVERRLGKGGVGGDEALRHGVGPEAWMHGDGLNVDQHRPAGVVAIMNAHVLDRRDAMGGRQDGARPTTFSASSAPAAFIARTTR
jgi:hypothetical protein